MFAPYFTFIISSIYNHYNPFSPWFPNLSPSFPRFSFPGCGFSHHPWLPPFPAPEFRSSRPGPSSRCRRPCWRRPSTMPWRNGAWCRRSEGRRCRAGLRGPGSAGPRRWVRGCQLVRTIGKQWKTMERNCDFTKKTMRCNRIEWDFVKMICTLLLEGAGQRLRLHLRAWELKAL